MKTKQSNIDVHQAIKEFTKTNNNQKNMLKVKIVLNLCPEVILNRR